MCLDLNEKTLNGEDSASALFWCIFLTGLIEQRGGSPLLSVLPDVLEWPIATDDWDTKYGILDVLFCCLMCVSSCPVSHYRGILMFYPPLQDHNGEQRTS